MLMVNSGCVMSSLHTVIKELRQQHSLENKVNEKVLQRIQSLRIQQQVQGQMVSFSFKQRESHLVLADKYRLDKLLLPSVTKVVLHMAPATADSSFAQIVLATQRADEIFKFITNGVREVEIIFAPAQAVDTLIIELES